MRTAETADSARVRRGTLRLALLAAVLLLAGLLPWLTGGALAARLVALPLLLAGAGVAAVAVRVRSVLLRAFAVQPSAPPVERTCAGCACGGGGCASLGAEQAPPTDPRPPAAAPAADAGMTAGSTRAAQPARTAGSTRAAQPARTAGPAPAAQPARTAGPAPAAQPARTAGPAPAAQPARTAGPAKADAAGRTADRPGAPALDRTAG